MSDKERLMNLLGLAQRAGKTETGTDFVLTAIQQQKARLVIIASDASANLSKKINDKGNFYKVQVASPITGAELSTAVGHKRSVIAIMDPGFAKAIAKLLQ
ncbi:YlxQ-related RNA-binding protein [Lacticaseibacillus zhaodongensis]|uniref:YlxQ-related RNA-binding protein n=1 Tax=Lacticaseibacillus zhaodongensis TaxID=2668065 RepID=UPI0012D34984|nr:YlxQ-related RNA-binding protein [Lacticaseibacillus zhaodongensis]